MVLLCCTSTMHAQDVERPVESTTPPKLYFPSGDTFDFGRLKTGDKRTHLFLFTNTGGEPLLIHTVTASCGCTLPQWPRKAVPPGATDTIKVTFSAVGYTGAFKKEIYIESNAPAVKDQDILYLKGNIQP